MIKSYVAIHKKLRTSTHLSTIVQFIVDSHDGAVKAEDIWMCLDHYNKQKEHHLDLTKRLCDVGITVQGTKYKLIYDFTPMSYPLLTTPPVNVFDKKK